MLLELKHASHQRLNSLLADVMKIDGTAFEPEDPVALRQSLQCSGREPSHICLNILGEMFCELNFRGLKRICENRKIMRFKNLPLYGNQFLPKVLTT